DTAHALEPAHSIALEDAGCARRRHAVARELRHVVVGRARAARRDAVVDRAVAVIVEAIAELGRRRDVAHAIEDAVRASEDAHLAKPDVAAARRARLREVPVVDHAVAVVVEAVARLRAGILRADAGPRAGLAFERSAIARR